VENFRLRNSSHAESRLPIPSRIVDRLVVSVLALIDALPFLEHHNFICGEVLRNHNILLPFEQDLIVTLTYHPEMAIS
jgi:hypothetical protein